MRKDEGTRVWFGHLAALGVGLLGLALTAQLIGGALGGLILGAVSGLMP
ncbi:MAG: hypothetical protein LBS27_02840 [Bifidobacteriaceae bacterium]|jgi:hypothetical protein|nr:hypothetical protein [Bifidobacteriaceae bacterium]